MCRLCTLKEMHIQQNKAGQTDEVKTARTLSMHRVCGTSSNEGDNLLLFTL